MSNFDQRRIGSEIIHAEQKICGDKILEIFKNQNGPPLLIAQMQQGKTGVCIYVINEFINNCESQNLKYEVIYLTNISDNDLKNQVDERIFDAKLNKKVKIIHHADLKNCNINNCNRRLIIIDECHVALEKLKPFDEFLKKCGINYGEDIISWPNKNNYVLSVSATPYAQVIVSKLDNKSFEPVIMDVNINYFSIENMKSRIRPSIKTVEKGKITNFFDNRIKDFIKVCAEEKPGYMIVRSVGNNSKIIAKYIENNYPDVSYKIYSADEGNIIHLDSKLSKCPPEPFIAIIKGSLRAGKTLRTTKNIRMWIEPENSKTDTVCQAIGRCCGYPGEDSHKKDYDKFLVFCNTKELQVAIEFFQNQIKIPSGRNNKTNVDKKDFKIIICKFDELPDELKNSKKANFAYICGTSSRSKDKSTDYALNLACEIWKDFGTNTPVCHIDKPHPKFQKSFNELQNKHKTKNLYSGDFYAYRESLLPNDEQITNDITLVKNNSILRTK
jgi:hypothetical protein